MEFSREVTPIDNYSWIGFYIDGSYDVEQSPSNFPSLVFNKLHHFTLWPKIAAKDKIAICIMKDPNYRLIWRKQRHVTSDGVYLGSDYMLGLEPDDGSILLSRIEAGFEDTYLCSRNNPNGFRIWITKEGEIKTYGRFKRTEEIHDVDGMTIRYIICEIDD